MCGVVWRRTRNNPRLGVMQRVFSRAAAARRSRFKAQLVSRGRLAKDPVGLNRPHGGGAMGIESVGACPGPRVLRREACSADAGMSFELARRVQWRCHVCAASVPRRRWARACKGTPGAWRDAARRAGTDGWNRVHGGVGGGPRGKVPGRKDSMRTIWPRPQCGQSRSDTPVRRWYWSR